MTIMKNTTLFKWLWGLGFLVVLGLNVAIFGYLFKGDTCSSQSQRTNGSYASPMQPSLPQDEETIALRMLDFLMEIAAKR